MHPDLEHLVRLQEIDLAADQTRRQIAELPGRIATTRARVTQQAASLAAARERLAESQGIRRTLEKDLAQVQGRLSKFKGQLMEVKTNKEYQAVQKEIATAAAEVRSYEDQLLERMLEVDELGLVVSRSERALADEERTVEQEERAFRAEQTALEQEIDRLTQARQRVGAYLTAETLELYEDLLARRGMAVVEARDGHCGSCQLRLRPQVFNQIRQNDSIIRCESCQRILFFAATPVTDARA